MSKKIRVAAGVIESGGRVLVARRKQGRSLAGYWEFPGGKIEEGESGEAALIRELFEEFSIQARAGSLIGTHLHRYPDLEVELLAYWAEHVAGEFLLRDHDEIRWVFPAELVDYRLAPADVPFVRRILESGRSST